MEIADEGIETIELVNGMTDDPKNVADFRKRWLGNVDAAFETLCAQKEAMFEHNRVRTPDPHFDRMVNGWLKQQTLFGATWCRWGYMGYRDIVQHGMGVSSFAPERTRDILLEALRYQKKSLALALEGKAKADEARARINIASGYLRLGQFDLAFDELESALGIARALKDRKLEQTATSLQGAAYFDIGDYDRALALADLIGLDVCLDILDVLYVEFRDPKYRPCPLLVKMVDAGRLGRKSGRGFYDYA